MSAGTQQKGQVHSIVLGIWRATTAGIDGAVSYR